jgi:hypothetical protein
VAPHQVIENDAIIFGDFFFTFSLSFGIIGFILGQIINSRRIEKSGKNEKYFI